MATSFSFVTGVGGAGTSLSSSSNIAPFYIPLHFQQNKNGQSSKQQIGPKVPSKNWRKRWQRPSQYDDGQTATLPNGLKRLTKNQPNDVWIDDELERWVTSMTVWSVEGMADDGDLTVMAPVIRIDAGDTTETNGKINVNTEASFGNIQGGRRIALGTQDGNIWILQETSQETAEEEVQDKSYESVNMTPSTSQNGINGLLYRSTGSRSSIALASPTSPSAAKTGERDSVTSPVLPMSATSDVVVSAKPVSQNNAGMDAEEYLERQWHAGRESQGMMSGMMEALGIQQHSNQSHDHPHAHQHEHVNRHSPGNSSPGRRHRQSSASSKSHVRSRHESIATDAEYDEKNDIRSAIANIGLKGTLGSGSEKKKELHTFSNRPQRRVEPMQQLEPLLSLQCPTDSPIESLKHIQTSSNKDGLLILQENGELTMWALEGSLQARTIDLKTAKAPPIDRVDDHLPAQSTTYFNSPLARLAALRSNAPSPQPRSRANSNASNPASISDNSSLPVVSSFEEVPISRTSTQVEKMSHIQAFYDKAKMRLHIVDCERWMVIFQHSFDNIGFTKPTLSITEDNGSIEIYFLNQKGALEIESHRIKPKPKQITSAEAQKLAPISSTSAFLRREGISRPTSRPASIIEEIVPEPKTKLGDVGIEREAKGLFIVDNHFILTWSEMGMSVAKHSNDSLIHSDTLTLQGIDNVEVKNDLILVQFEAQVSIFQITSKGELLEDKKYEFEDECDIATLADSCTEPISCLRDENDKFILKSGTNPIWKDSSSKEEGVESSLITASLPFSMERIVLSLSSGHLVMCSMVDLVAGRIPEPKDTNSNYRGTVKLLQTIINPRTNSRHLIGGTEEGDVILWDAITLKCQMQKPMLTSPVVAFVAIGNQDNALRLHGTVACIGADSTIAFIVLDQMQLLYIVPGRDAPLEMMAVRSNELMTIYADGRARVWSATDLELRRSIGVDQALVLLEDGKGWWSQFPINVAHLKRERGTIGVLSSIPSARSLYSGAMTADVRRVVEAASRMVSPIKSTGNVNGRDSGQTQEHFAENIDPLASVGHKLGSKLNLSLSLAMPQGKKALHTLRPLLCCILPLGIDKTFDEHCRTVLNLTSDEEYGMGQATGLFNEPGFLALSFHGADPKQSLCIAPAITATRLVASIAMLLVLSNIAELQKSALELISLLDNLSNLVGPSIQQPSIEFLIGFLTDPVLEIKQAAQMLFVSSLEGMPQEELDAICSQFSDALPNRRSVATSKTVDAVRESMETTEEEERNDQHSSKALLLLGLIATQRYTVMPPNLLKDISMSISLYLNDEHDPAHQSIAIVLCDRGFSIFQHYFDAMEVVRTIFSLSTALQQNNLDETQTNNRKVNVVQIGMENRDLARQATLRIAEENTPLFMTTLSLDILHARSPEHCSATMRLVAFMVRRKPLVLYPNLPRLAEAVVKSLDPTVTTLRTVIHKSATIIISELISAYPTIAFHKGTQRLAVGTFEGAIIMYDLKTATRLYVLEAHGTSLNGLTFSNDGRRLISICLQDGMVKVWKTGIGLGSLFSFGAAPRQMGALLARATGVVNETGNGPNGKSGEGKDLSTDLSNTGTPPYKSFDFGRMAGSALASVRLAAIRSPSLSSGSGLLSPRGSISSGHAISLIEREEEEAAFMSDLHLIRFEWLAERSIKIRIGEATLVFDVA